jgi:hypothetical protein
VKVIYVAGPFRGSNHWAMAENVRHAERWAFQIALAGHMPFCPHANTKNFHGALPDQFFIEGTAEILRRCDGAVFIPGWTVSRDSQAEFEICKERKIPVCDLDGLTMPQQALGFWLERYSRHGVER